MEIIELSGKRFDAAMDLLREGKKISFSGIEFELKSNNKFSCQVQSTWQPERITENRVLEDLLSARKVKERLCKESYQFKELIEGKELEVSLINNYGMGSILICIENRHRIEWKNGFPIAKNI